MTPELEDLLYRKHIAVEMYENGGQGGGITINHRYARLRPQERDAITRYLVTRYEEEGLYPCARASEPVIPGPPVTLITATFTNDERRIAKAVMDELNTSYGDNAKAARDSNVICITGAPAPRMQ